MNGVFGTILVIVVTGIVVGAVVPMMFHLVLRELEEYQSRRTAKACQVLAKTTEVMTKHFAEMMDNLLKGNMSNKEKADQLFRNADKWVEESIKNKETNI